MFGGFAMGLQIVDDEGQPTRFPQEDKRPARKANPEAPADKPLDAKTTKLEVQRALSVVYNLLHKILRDDVRYAVSDFSEEADGIIELLNQHSMLRIALRIIAPLAMIGAIYEKVEGTLSRLADRKKQAKAKAEAAKNPAPIVVASNGLTPEQVAARPFAR
jgi:hypothetical protein